MTHPTELLTLWHRLLGFAKAMLDQRTGKRALRAKRHQPRPP